MPEKLFRVAGTSLSFLAVVAAAACMDSADSTGMVGAGDVTALFELPVAGQTSEFYALPFPNDLRRKQDGTLDLAGHSRDNNPTLETWINIFAAKTHGFGTNSAVYFRFSGTLDGVSLPADGAATTAATSSVYLVNVDAASPEKGQKTPIRCKFTAEPGRGIGGNWLACLPYPGFPLRPATQYAAVVTRRVTSKGEPVKSSADFDRVRAGTDATAVYAPLLAWLNEAGGDAPADVASATVFTTQDPVSLMAKLREVIRRPCENNKTFPDCIPPPVATFVERKNTAAAFDTFEGKYDTPLFQQGTIPYTTQGGEILLNEAGDPIPQAMQTIRFAVTIPNGAMPLTGWPIVVYAHGTGGSYRSFINDGTAQHMADEGLAVISIDQILHGPRDPSSGNVEILFFNFLNPVAARDNVRQGGADDYTLVRLVEQLTVSEGVATHKFDPEKIYFMGHSQGGLTGPMFLPFEPKIKAAVLSGAGGLIYIALLYKTMPAPSVRDAVALFIKDEPLDEFNPFLNLVQMYIEPADPMNYGRYMVKEPWPGVPAKDIFQTEGFTDSYAPILGIEAFGVSMGLSPVAPQIQAVPGFALRNLPLLKDFPIMHNAGDHTAVFMQYMAPPQRDGHFVIFDVPAAEKQHAKFLSSLAETGTATLVAP